MRMINIIRLAIETFLLKYGKYPPFILISKKQSNKLLAEEGKHLFVNFDPQKYEIFGVPLGIVGEEQTIIDLSKLEVD